jgi:hypothetical protein
LKAVIADVELEYAVDIKLEVQPRQCFDLNANDAFLHHELKRLAKNEGIAINRADVKAKFKAAKEKISPRAIQKGFLRSYSRDENGDLDEDLIPDSILQWATENNIELSDKEEASSSEDSSSTESSAEDESSTESS